MYKTCCLTDKMTNLIEQHRLIITCRCYNNESKMYKTKLQFLINDIL